MAPARCKPRSIVQIFSCLPIGTGAAIFRERQFRHVAVFGQHFKPLRLYRAVMALSEVNSNSGTMRLGTFQLSGCALTRCCRNRTPNQTECLILARCCLGRRSPRHTSSQRYCGPTWFWTFTLWSRCPLSVSQECTEAIMLRSCACAATFPYGTNAQVPKCSFAQLAVNHGSGARPQPCRRG
jgi:hypothetical protein